MYILERVPRQEKNEKFFKFFSSIYKVDVDFLDNGISLA
ncbi:hypothetical protein SORDD16_00638 [Streptococcus oralis]|uniref:Uncharacterized protein n=1 Tax=Streptococcus oralis TaxID=1303 RepID=A0A139PEV2_STROR|nr:hypothetical protein SORDD16_00638 [Streptococcus oralis]